MAEIMPLGPRDPRSIGDYQVLGRLGSGGQGIVYLGRDGVGQHVAIKMINIGLQHDLKAKARFVKEIEAARRVASFCTAQIIAADVYGEAPYVVSEYIAGPTLRRHVQENGPVSGNALHRLAVGSATALAAIHRSHVVHCDLKPDNIVLGGDGPRVIDFGIARALDVTATMTGQIIGTAPYMAPERFHGGKEIGPACDVFAWAATIAYAAAGRPPFGDDSIYAVMHRVLHEAPDLPALPAPLDALTSECLAKDPGARPRAEEILLRLLGYAARPAADVPMETMLWRGTATATAAAGPGPAPVPSGSGLSGSGLSGPMPSGSGPSAPASPAPGWSAPAPAAPGSAAPASSGPGAGHPWPRRLRQEYADPWGVSAAIFLGACGAAAGYVASPEIGPAAVVAVTTFAVVYTVRLLIASVLPPRATVDPGGAQDTRRLSATPEP